MATPSVSSWRWPSPAQPRLLLMDEPTAGMAPASAALPMQLARRLADSDRIAVLFTEHDMDVVFGYADRVIVLDRGRIIAKGRPPPSAPIHGCRRSTSGRRGRRLA